MISFENSERILYLWPRFIIVALGHPVLILSSYFLWGNAEFSLGANFFESINPFFAPIYRLFLFHIFNALVIYYLWLKLQITILKIIKDFDSAALINSKLALGLWVSIPCLLSAGIVMFINTKNLNAATLLLMFLAALSCVSSIMFFGQIIGFFKGYYDNK